MKFGGSSVGSSDRIKQVIQIVKKSYDNDPSLVVVVSAFGGTTDELIRIATTASQGKPSYLEDLSKLRLRHEQAIAELIADGFSLDVEFNELNDALHGIQLIRELSKRSLDYIMSFGERLSAMIICKALGQLIPSALYVDARPLIKTDDNFGHARVNYNKSNALISGFFSKNTYPCVMTGFIGSTENQETTTLGRGGSDYTASIVGAALKADEIEIWTDVDGVMTADPRKVKEAFPVLKMSYKEALELSHFGAKVIYPPTIVPALRSKIPLRIKNTFSPDGEGTFITNESTPHESQICGVSSIDSVALLRVEGGGLVGVCGTAMRLFGALAKKEINVIMISQASSEHSICFAIEPKAAAKAKQALEEEFYLEQQAGMVDPIVVEDGLSLIAVVGENMRELPGVAGKLFGVLGKNGVNVVAMAQGSSEYNITFAVKQTDEKKALNVIHEEFFQSLSTTVNVFLVGTGLIGKTLLNQMRKQLPVLLKQDSLHIKVTGLANSQKMCFDPEGLDLEKTEELLEKAAHNMDIAEYVKNMRALNLMNSVFVDCTASEQIAEAYPSILDGSIAIVTPNKKANSGRYKKYHQLKEISKKRGVRFIYETNVGAGLPIISTIIDLLKSGDTILKIEAILSGTLSYLFNVFNGSISFSEVLREAQRKGFTEPDPREDLSGRDVMRKLLILARECGFPMELEDISIETLLPAECFDAKNVEEFYTKLTNYDGMFEQKYKQAAQHGNALRYIASFDGKARIALQEVSKQHPFYHLSGSDNIIALTTERYKETPLVIKGQGAGAEVTAGEVFADIIRIASS